LRIVPIQASKRALPDTKQTSKRESAGAKIFFTKERGVIDSGAGRGKLSGAAGELDVLQLFEAKPLAVHGHPKVAQVDGVLGASDFGANHPVLCFASASSAWTKSAAFSRRLCRLDIDFLSAECGAGGAPPAALQIAPTARVDIFITETQFRKTD